VCLPPGLFAYCAVIINTVILLNKCQFPHCAANSNYLIQQNSHHTWTTTLANYWRALAHGGLVQPIFSILGQHLKTLKNFLVISILLSEVSRVHNHTSHRPDVSLYFLKFNSGVLSKRGNFLPNAVLVMAILGFM